jgi:hypothetical protein
MTRAASSVGDDYVTEQVTAGNARLAEGLGKVLTDSRALVFVEDLAARQDAVEVAAT